MSAISPALDTEALMWVTQRPELVFTEGRGSWLTDSRGKRYLDFVQGWAVNCLGHCPPVIQQALSEQAGRLINPSPAFFNPPAARLARRLAEVSCFERVFFANSGAEANEGAIKLARRWGQKFRNGAFEIITFENSFHGRTLATMSASGKPGWDRLFAPQVAGFPKARLNDLESVEALIGAQTVAVMLEPIQGEGGVIPAHPLFMQALRNLTREAGLLLIVDEVQTGMGRCGSLFAYQQAAIEPDLMTLGKGIGGGVPLAALLASEAACCFEAGDQGGTYNGNPLMTAVGLAVLETLLAPGFLDQVAATGDYLGEIGLADFKRDIDPPLPAVPECGWVLSPRAQGRGVASEALAAVIAWAEGHFGPTPMVCIIAPGNAASLRVAEKAGFREVRRALYHDNETVVLERPARVA